MMNDSMVCKRVYSADGIKLKARHITVIPQGTGSSSPSIMAFMRRWLYCRCVIRFGMTPGHSAFNRLKR